MRISADAATSTDPHTSVALTTPSEQSLVEAARRELAEVPVNDSVTTAEFMERLDSLRTIADGLNRGIQHFTDLKTSHHNLMQVLAQDISHPRHIARRIDMDPDAVSVMLENLDEKGYVHITERIGDRIIDASLTDAGYAALSQAEAIQFRALDALLQQAPKHEVERLNGLLEEATHIAQGIVSSLTEPAL
ncbi:MarR family winged helix-turn-helix transcriptional regulator [Timonella sp. A28]|uniref:MarR family winged helix-turn-helix transcriptional regulator n=1 Tax=Timonella sp. A28 TaxID=3442640 RepID=UPI003EBB5A00